MGHATGPCAGKISIDALKIDLADKNTIIWRKKQGYVFICTGSVMDNWDEIRTAFQVARVGTVSGAAEVLGVHHATVIRHIDALEGGWVRSCSSVTRAATPPPRPGRTC
jgi:hypothetical protein